MPPFRPVSVVLSNGTVELPREQWIVASDSADRCWNDTPSILSVLAPFFKESATKTSTGFPAPGKLYQTRRRNTPVLFRISHRHCMGSSFCDSPSKGESFGGIDRIHPLHIRPQTWFTSCPGIEQYAPCRPRLSLPPGGGVGETRAPPAVEPVGGTESARTPHRSFRPQSSRSGANAASRE